jgi:hypothetical protein
MAEEMKTATTAKEAFDISSKNFKGNLNAAGNAALSRTIGIGGNVTGLVGKGVEALGGTQLGQELQNAGKRVQAGAEDYFVGANRERYPVATNMGGLATDVAVTLPVGGAIGGVIKAAAPYVPSVARFITPVAESIATGGFKTGLGPTGAIKPITGLPGYTARDVAAEVAARATGGAVLGGASTAITHPEDIATGATVGALLPTVGAGLVKAGITGGARVLDLLSGRAGDIKAARIAKTALGDQLIPATLALQQARPGITAIQALQEAGIDAAPFMSLGVLAEQSSIGEAYRRLAAAQTQEQKNMLIAMAGGRTQTEVQNSLIANKGALNDLTTPMRETELQAANQAASARIGYAGTPQDVLAKYASVIYGTPQASTTPNFAGTQNTTGQSSSKGFKF